MLLQSIIGMFILLGTIIFLVTFIIAVLGIFITKICKKKEKEKENE